MNISISIIIPVYNSISFIEQCLISLMKQDYSLLEFIVIDDGSTDGSAEICDEYARKDNRFHVYHQSNQGIAAARNSGLQHVHGEYIAWVDSDDYVSNNWIHSIINAINDSHPDCLLFDYSILYTYGIRTIHFARSSQFLSQDTYIYELSCDNRLPSYLWRQVIKKDIWLNYSFSAGIQIMEDYQVLTKLAVHIKKIYYINDTIYFYRQHVGSLTKISSLRDTLLCLTIAQERYAFFSQYGYHPSKSGVIKVMLSYIYQYHKSEKLGGEENKSEKYYKLYKKHRKDIKQNFIFILTSSGFSMIEKIKASIEIIGLGIIFIYLMGFIPARTKYLIRKIMHDKK